MHFLLFSPSSYLPLLTTHNSLFMQGKPAHLQLRGSVPEPARPRVECLLCSRDLLFPSPDEHRSSSSSEDELPATKGKKKCYVIFSAKSCLQSFESRSWPYERLHVTAHPGVTAPLSKRKQVFLSYCPSSWPGSQLVDSKFPPFHFGKLLSFDAYACLCQCILQNVS